MISRKALIISPLLSVSAVTAVLVGAAYWLAKPAPPIVYEEMVNCHTTIDLPPVPQDLGPLHVDNFPTYFQGYFHWDGETRADQQNVGLDVHDVGLNAEGLIVATGRATYNTNYRNIDFTFRIEVNPDTNEFVMWESEPNQGGFVTTGRHEATIASFDEVHARWVGDDGMHGTLKLWPAEGSMRFNSSDVGENAPHRHPTALGNGVYMQKGKTTGTDCVVRDSDQVMFEWTGRMPGGTFFDSASNEGLESTTPQVASPGFRRAFKQLCVGESARLYVPTEMAFPQFNTESGPSHVMFDVEVHDVLRPEW